MNPTQGLLLTCLLVGCSAGAGSTPAPSELRTITVFAAASLSDAFAELAAAFEAAHPGVDVRLNFGASNALRLQIEAGAQADVFASANRDEMQALIDADRVMPQTDRALLENTLVVILPPGNPGELQSIQDLARPGLKLLLAAEEVPAGRYARRVLANLGGVYGTPFEEGTLANVVSNEENVRLVLTKVELGEADVGIVYLSDAAAAPDLPRLEIPACCNVVATYWISPVRDAADPETAALFVAFAVSTEGQTLLRRWGFASPAGWVP